ncbi:DNA-directed RNA polymerase, mitochondrial [Cyphellophora attinorum]|uniref:DNA-directed RNA polymerase n=1 Tax=Cyphellophora attinorum TaxID=1664694 RepID=A0A0N1HRR5_9EURO|nr:DNA-directed RNA polymerase, mitochondrial [Phialophora attinorum]KPI38587.1 DNA-directed RNA polymerase, mitochondrial [Phialophora attinorum]
MDFRGRAYPIPPYLNQMGADHCRGLLRFANGRPLGKRGLWWLKIQLSNVYGFDKASLSDRAKFPMDHLEEIRDSVEHPFDGKRWWLTAEDPWQCLAACHELVEALKAPNPEEFISHLPVHQDGSCNGLQHYAALGGDVEGARQVNLEPGDKPADVYSGVCDLVSAEVAADAAKGHEIAALLNGRLKRKIVKQTVMTNVYGVTFMGATAQVRKQIDALLPDIGEKRLSGRASLYIAEKIFRALGQLFNGAQTIQYWLGDCANRISSSVSPAQMDKITEASSTPGGGETTHAGRRKPSAPSKVKSRTTQLKGSEFRSSVIWTTPLKLPVVQPYRQAKGASIQTNLQAITLYEPTVADAVDKRKQLQAFPPNFIHSLDASHMLLSALKLDELGLSFAAVHDSFWTHAADVDVMNRLLREAFIRMHSEDIIGRLAAEFNKRYENHVYMAEISKTSPVAKAISEYRKNSGRRSVTQQKNYELLREIEKRRLMASEDPTERKKGAEMVTAATIFKDFRGDRHIISKDSLGQTAMAAVPKGVTEGAAEAALEQHATETMAASNQAPNGPTPADQEVDDDLTEMPTGTTSLDGSESAPSPGSKQRQKKKSAHSNNQTWAWLPLTFRPVPEKGTFDVRRLRDSQYFFS